MITVILLIGIRPVPWEAIWSKKYY